MRNNPCSCTMLPFITPGVLLTYCVAFNELWYLLNWIQFIFFIFQHLQVTESHNDSTTTCSLRSYSRLNDVHNKQPGNKMEESFMDRSSASKIQRESTSVTSFWNVKRRSSSPVGPCSCSLHVMGLTLHWPEGALTFVKQIYIKSPIIVLE